MPVQHPHDWAIVLAGGSGTRLSCVARDGRGRSVPKQYCSLNGGPSLLGLALARAACVVPARNVVVVVAAEHRCYWEPELRDHPRANVVVQPCNRGTAPGVLLPLLAVLERDPRARVVLVPSDHFVAREDVLARALVRALEASGVGPRAIQVLGMDPENDEEGYGFILPAAGEGPLEPVAAFVEKPDAPVARQLRRSGAVWNSFLLAARGHAFVGAYQQRLPALLDGFLGASPHLHAADAEALYRTLPASDFSRDVLTGSEEHLQLHRVPACGWTDLGTPERVRACLREHRQANRPGRQSALDLAAALGLT